ncbi:uncharacterized protein G2W53_039298 [Senna tora]|uniref:Uncharacterized protein n=1 Tax=Senna tora TaxID=362788 RepID=A0A834ST45_9FABA|nr:uncharacterized protein G2W53_039298 [Senna tora]
MENTHLWVPKEDPNFAESEPKRLAKPKNSCRVDDHHHHHHGVVVNMIQSQISRVSLKDFFFQCFHHEKLDSNNMMMIPKNIVSVDEKYLRRCLELIQISAFKGARCSIGVNSRIMDNSGRFLFECPVGAVGTDHRVAIRASGNNLRSNRNHLFHQFGGLEKTQEKGLVKRDSSPSGFSVTSSSFQLGKEKGKETPMVIIGKKFSSMSSSFHQRLPSTSSSSNSTLPHQGMLQCTWKEGIPHFVFSEDDQKEVYVTKLRRARPVEGNKALDYEYLFHLDSDSQLVGKMNVSTSFTLGPNNDKVRETEFVLFGEIYDQEMDSSRLTEKKKNKNNKGMSKKLSQLLRTSSPLSKHRTFSKLGGSNDDIEETCAWEPLESRIAPNLELAAIVVRTQNALNPSDHEVGGWGLKFLNKSRSVASDETCMRSSTSGGDCSTSMSILIPAGPHGGPRTRNGGPSSLADRWRSGGRCDCGGWDEGCPLTVLQRRSDVVSEENMQEECKTVDLITQCIVVVFPYPYCSEPDSYLVSRLLRALFIAIIVVRFKGFHLHIEDGECS